MLWPSATKSTKSLWHSRVSPTIKKQTRLSCSAKYLDLRTKKSHWTSRSTSSLATTTTSDRKLLTSKTDSKSLNKFLKKNAAPNIQTLSWSQISTKLIGTSSKRLNVTNWESRVSIQSYTVPLLTSFLYLKQACNSTLITTRKWVADWTNLPSHQTLPPNKYLLRNRRTTQLSPRKMIVWRATLLSTSNRLRTWRATLTTSGERKRNNACILNKS